MEVKLTYEGCGQTEAVKDGENDGEKHCRVTLKDKKSSEEVK